MPKLLKRFIEQTDLEPARVVIQNDGDPIAAFSDIHDQAGNRHIAPRLCVIALATTRLRRRLGRDIRKLAVNQVIRVLTNRIKWMFPSGKGQVPLFR